MTTSHRSDARLSRDFDALTAPIDAADLKRFKDAERDSPFGAAAEQGTGHSVTVDAWFGLVGVFAVVAGIAVAMTVDASSVGHLLIVLALLVFVVVCAIVYFRARGNLLAASTWRRWYRLVRFANANGMSFRAKLSNPNFSGAIFHSGTQRVAHDVLVIKPNRYTEVGNYSYSGTGRLQRRHEWGYLRVQLDRKLPHLVLKSNLHRSFLDPKFSASFNHAQTLSLEGDFDNYFTLFAPVEYKRDALYVFTPDLMALLIDEAAHLDVEIADDWLYVYSRKPFEMLASATYERAERIAATVGTKTVRQTRNYIDDKGAPDSSNAVAQHGQRLTQRVPRVVVVVCLLPAIGVVGLLARLVIWMFGGPGFGR